MPTVVNEIREQKRSASEKLVPRLYSRNAVLERTRKIVEVQGNLGPHVTPNIEPKLIQLLDEHSSWVEI